MISTVCIGCLRYQRLDIGQAALAQQLPDPAGADALQPGNFSDGDAPPGQHGLHPAVIPGRYRGVGLLAHKAPGDAQGRGDALAEQGQLQVAAGLLRVAL